jgi:hypothetical protein
MSGHFGFGYVGGLDGNDQFTKILLHMDGANAGTTFTDENRGGAAHTWTAHGATTSTTAFKFGTTSEACGAGVGYIDTPDSTDYTLGSGAWTVDFWFNVQGGAGATRYMFGQNNAAGTVWSYIGLLTTANVIRINLNSGTFKDGTTAITTTGWHHYAAVRTGNIVKLFLDGVQEGGDLAFAVGVTDSADTFSIGRGGAFATAPFNGFIDEFRLSVGVARWTANFTPPVRQYR